jgi:hypothetical protein
VGTPRAGSCVMDIVAEYDSSVAGAPAGYKIAVQAAIDYLDQVITNPVTVTIMFSYGEIDGQTMSTGALGESSTNGYIEPFSQVVSWLTAAASSQAANASIPGEHLRRRLEPQLHRPGRRLRRPLQHGGAGLQSDRPQRRRRIRRGRHPRARDHRSPGPDQLPGPAELHGRHLVRAHGSVPLFRRRRWGR